MRGRFTWVLIFIVALTRESNAQPGELRVIKNPDELKIIPLSIINSAYRETNLSITPDGKFLFFMSLRGGNPWSTAGYSFFRGEERYDGDIWYSKKIDGKWSEPECLPETVNTSSAEDEPNISPDGSYVLYQSWRDSWFTDGGPYYFSKLNGSDWSMPEGMSGGVNQYFKIEFRKHDGYATDGAALSPDGKIFLVALAPNYNDSMDIYISRKEKNIWTYLKKTSLSTPGDERSIFIAGDNKTVYFGSNGYGGYGGMDIFKTTLHEDDSFGEIVNIGEPFNSAEDDFGFIVTSSGEESYFIRNDDIYYCDLRLASRDIKPLPSIIITGVVTDIFGYPIPARVTVSEKSTGELKAESNSNSKTGEYTISMRKEEGEYLKEVTADGYKPDVSQFYLDSINYEEKNINTVLVENGTLLLQYDFDQFELSQRNRSLLDSLSSELYKNKNLRLIMAGHTDEKGTDRYNMDLSRKRVMEAGNYLMSKGIPKGIMKLNFFGESRPRAGMQIVNHDALNRRVEIRIVDLKK